MHQNNIFFIFKKLFLTSTHQNDMKTLKKNYFEVKKKIVFEMQKQTGSK
jgi:hypothetical protein